MRLGSADTQRCLPLFSLLPSLPGVATLPHPPLSSPQTWMDVDQMSGSTLEAMAKAVEESCVLIMCVSKKYKESQVRDKQGMVITDGKKCCAGAGARKV